MSVTGDPGDTAALPGGAVSGDARAGDARAGDARAGDARAGDARAGDARRDAALAELERQVLEAAVELGHALRARGWKVACAESCTGGLVCRALTEIGGSSEWFERGFVTYSNAAKAEMLGVGAATLEAHGAVSEPVAREMSDGALARSQAQLSLSITGIAGPGGAVPGKPVGTVCFGWALLGAASVTETVRFEGDRSSVRARAALHVLCRARERLAEQGSRARAGASTRLND